jgi:uncharacterized membrane protein (UPF0127 family)
MGRLALRARGSFMVAAFVLLFFSAAAFAQAQKLEALTIVSGSARHAFQVEVMREEADRAQGLMYRRALAPDRGMLFDFGRVEPVSMWMKNTYLSLDMLFIRPDGTIARIATDTEPLSTRTISSGEPVNGVLEVAAGTTARLGIKPGDRVEHPMFRKR